MSSPSYCPHWLGPAPRLRLPKGTVGRDYVLLQLKLGGKGPFDFVVDTGLTAEMITPHLRQVGAGLQSGGPAWLCLRALGILSPSGCLARRSLFLSPRPLPMPPPAPWGMVGIQELSSCAIGHSLSCKGSLNGSSRGV